MKDVAAKAGVSVFTVSSVINNSPRVRAATRAKVLRAIKQLDYTPNFAAKSLRTQRSNTIGVLVPLFWSQTSLAFFGTVSDGIHSVLRENGFHMILSDVSQSFADEKQELENLSAKGVDGLIYTPGHSRKMDFLRPSFPIVLLDRDVRGFTGDRVFNNNYESAIQGVEFLIRKGHTRIAYVGRKGMYSNHRDRYRGYRHALEKNGLRFDERLAKHPSSSQERGMRFGYSVCGALVAQRTTAVFCNESFGTIGIVKYCQEHGIAIPQDLALMTYDDLEWSEIVDPPLTAIRQPTYEMGRLAATTLLRRIAGSKLPPRKYVLASELVVRGST